MIIPTSNRLAQVSSYYFAQKLAEIDTMNQDGGRPVINLGIGSPDFLPADEVIQKLREAVTQKDAHKYQSYKGIPSLRNAFANWYKKHFDVIVMPDKEILPLIGSKEGVMHISMTFVNPGDHVLVPDPGYPSYAACTRLAGGIPVIMPLHEHLGWKPDLDALRKTDLSKVKLMWVNYPNMPTGAKADKTFFQELVNFAIENGILLCHDNPYVFLLNDNPLSIFNAEGAKACAIELLSLSKCYNMAGWRVGAVTGDKSFIDAVMTFKSNMDSGMFRPLQEAAVVALGLGRDWIDNLNNSYQLRKAEAIRLFKLLDLEFSEDGAGLFLWGKIKGNQVDSEILSEKILQKCRVFITPGHVFGTQGDRFLRISLCSPESEISEAIHRIEDTISKNEFVISKDMSI
ncbi:MAG: aminotransferase class I/II-fold pyridoxal phosphate-dependent enzyme [Saprospiraceae bacterium]|nr:aminotransferase class I/II-fold pyridoxal phosphate-dependent enzyme [Saprospiraceae bacterium]